MPPCNPLSLPLACASSPPPSPVHCAGRLPEVFEDTSLGYIHDGMLKGQASTGPCASSAFRLSLVSRRTLPPLQHQPTHAARFSCPPHLTPTPPHPPIPPCPQLQEQLDAFLLKQAAAAAEASGGSSSDSDAAELPLVEHAAGFERYKVGGRPLVFLLTAEELAGLRAARPSQGSQAVEHGRGRWGALAAPPYGTCCSSLAEAPALPPLQGVETEAYAHEAGYDAYMTGAVRQLPVFLPVCASLMLRWTCQPSRLSLLGCMHASRRRLRGAACIPTAPQATWTLLPSSQSRPLPACCVCSRHRGPARVGSPRPRPTSSRSWRRWMSCAGA